MARPVSFNLVRARLVDPSLGFLIDIQSKLLGERQQRRTNRRSQDAMDSSPLNSPELMHFINQEKERAMVQEMVAKLTSVCWDKCITGAPGSKFSSSESSCLSNCAQRYMDMSLLIVKRFQNMQ